MSSEADRYVVIGNPVAHSKSPAIHASFAVQTGQQIDYQRLLSPLDGFVECVQTFLSAGGKGANVTVPFKLEAFALATQLTSRAQAAGAVNTLRFDGVDIIGDNTDGQGLVADIVQNAGAEIKGKRILLIGAGGAARGAILPLLEQHPAELVIANRTLDRAQELVALASKYSAEATNASQAKAMSFNDVVGIFDIVINATSASLQNECPPISASVFSSHTLAYDMMYGAHPTTFLRFATEHGAKTRDGLGMLVEQAAASFQLWRGVLPATQQILAELRAALALSVTASEST